jgi:5-methyltetrahydrofolate--homocysteine methyltransferase
MSIVRQLQDLLSKRILIIDGAMGTMIQGYHLTEEDYRGQMFANHTMPQKGNNDLLSLSRPQVISEIHMAFLESGADIIETNTFNSNRISMEDYGMTDQVRALNMAAVGIARKAADAFTQANPNKPRFVAGAIGPTNKTASISPDVNNPGIRSVSFKDLEVIYREQAEALIDGGVDLILIETVFDTLNCKAALFAVNTIKEERGIDIPVMVSGTITDASGRTLSGQTPEAFWISVSHAQLFSIGFNCALGAKDMEPYLDELSRKSWVYVTAYPNAGLPNEFGEYDQSPDMMARQIKTFAENHWVNMVGGCCGTTPDHIKAIYEAVKELTPRKTPVLAL